MSDNIACIYEEIHYYKIENKLESIMILKKCCQFERNEGDKNDIFFGVWVPLKKYPLGKKYAKFYRFFGH